MDGTSAGAIFLDFSIRDRINAQIDDISKRAAQKAQKSFEGVGKQASDAINRSMSGAYSKPLEMAKKDLARLNKQFDDITAKLDAQYAKAQDRATMFNPGLTGASKDAATQDILGKDKSYNKTLAQQEAVAAKIAALEDKVAIETEAAKARAATAADKAAAAEERAAERTQAAAQKAAAAQERTAQRAEETKQRAVERSARQQQAAQAKAARESEREWKKSTKGIRRLFRSIGSALKATFLMATLYAFFRAFKTMIESAASQNSEFAASLAQVKGNLQTAFAPIMQAIMPAINSLMSGLAAASRAVASFIAGVFGTTFAKAQAAASKLSAVTAAAKKASSTMGIDELNVVQQDSGDGGVSSDFAQQGDEAAQSMGEKVKAVFASIPAMAQAAWDNIKTMYGPAISAWGAAWGQIQTKAVEVWPQVQTALSTLLKEHVEPLAAYLATDFAPTVANSFSEAFAPIYGDVLSGELEASANYITWYGGLIGDVMDNIVKPALETVKNIWSDMMGGIQSTWQKYGVGLVDGVITLFQNLQNTISNVYNTVLQPVITFLIDKIQALWNDSLKPLWDNVVGFFADVASYGLALYNNIILPIFNGLVDLLGPYIAKALEVFLSKVKLVIGVVADTFNILITVLRGILQFFTNVFQGNWQGAWDAVKNTVINVWDAVGRIIKNAVNGIIGIVNGMISAVVTGLNTVIDLANKLTYTVPKWVPVIGGSTWGLNIPTITAPQIPMLAGGDVITQPTLAMMGEYTGAKSNPEIVAPQSILKETFDASIAPLVAALMELVAYLQSGGMTVEAAISVLLDGQTVYRSMERIKAGRGIGIAGNPNFT